MAVTTVFSPAKPAEVWVSATTVGPDVPVIGINNQAGLTSTGTGDFTKSLAVGPFTLSGIPAGGVGLAAKEVAVYVDGTFLLPVVGGLVTTAQNVVVYIIKATGVLTLTVDGTTPANTPVYGKVNLSKDLVRVAGVLPVQIGA